MWDKVIKFFNGIAEKMRALTAMDFVILLAVIGAIYLVYLFITTVLRPGSAVRSEAQAVLKAREREEKKKKILLAIYRLTEKVPLLKFYIKGTSRAYRGLCNYDDATLAKYVSETVAIAFFRCSVGALAILALNLYLDGEITLFPIACIVFLNYIICLETLQSRINAKEKALTKELTHYFASVKHIYLAKKNVPEAIKEAADGMSREIFLLSNQLYEILSGTERKEKVREYALDQSTNRYLKLFISQAYEASERMDMVHENHEKVSLFAKNIEILRVGMLQDVCNQEKKSFRFKGYIFVATIPVFVMPVLRHWGMDFSRDMVEFYKTAGPLVEAFALLITLFSYDNINKAKMVSLLKGNKNSDFFDRKIKKGIIRKFMDAVELKHNPVFDKMRTMLKETSSNQSFGAFATRILLAVMLGTLFMVLFISSFHIRTRHSLVSEVTSLENVVYVTSIRQEEVITKNILDMTNEYLRSDDISMETLVTDFNSRMFLPNRESVNKICEEIQRRILEYRSEYFRWYEFVLSLLCGILFGFVPVLSLRYRHGIAMASKRDEIRQFQSIIIMERAFPGITIQEILEEMETFAVVYKVSLRECINSYSAGPREALVALKDRESSDTEFVEIVDGFLAVETVGAMTAFAEVENNRKMSESMHALNEDILLEKRTDYSELLSLLPTVVVMGIYFIVPFCYYVFGSIMEVFTMLEAFGA